MGMCNMPLTYRRSLKKSNESTITREMRTDNRTIYISILPNYSASRLKKWPHFSVKKKALRSLPKADLYFLCVLLAVVNI